jgi:hypothetical protein
MRKEEGNARVCRHLEAPLIAGEYPKIGKPELERGGSMVDKVAQTRPFLSLVDYCLEDVQPGRARQESARARGKSLQVREICALQFQSLSPSPPTERLSPNRLIFHATKSARVVQDCASGIGSEKNVAVMAQQWYDWFSGTIEECS